MGGRGRGGSKALSFSVESLGIMPGEALPGPCLQPPPAYPLLEQQPAPLSFNSSTLVQLGFKLNLLNHLSREVKNLNYAWEYFPYELRPGMKKRSAGESSEKSQAPVKASKPAASITNIDQLLAQLEKTETAQVKVEVDENEEKEQEEGPEEFDDTDEEMDDGTDYNQNYFDNGESYLDEDDDIDDGPIY